VEKIEHEPLSWNTKILPLRYNKNALSISLALKMWICVLSLEVRRFRFKNVLLETGESNGILSYYSFVLFVVKGTTFKTFVVNFRTLCITIWNGLLLQTHQHPEDEDRDGPWNVVFSPFNHLTRLAAQKHFIIKDDVFNKQAASRS
jgi:hypothetical protein